MSTAHPFPRPRPRPRPRRIPAHEGSDYEGLGACIYDGDPLTVITSRGPIVCLDEATYTQLLLSSQTPPITPVPVPAPMPTTTTRITAFPASTDVQAAVAAVRLTGREVQILGAIAAGQSPAEIADQLGLAVDTVARHLVSIRRKYRVRSTAAAVIAARAEGRL